MMGSRTNLRIFTVVDVWRGMAVGAKNFRRLRNAEDYMQRLRRGRNLMDDDVQLFETRIDVSSLKPRSVCTGV